MSFLLALCGILQLLLICKCYSLLIMRCIDVGTGDHTYDRRLRLGGPLVKQNIATMVLER